MTNINNEKDRTYMWTKVYRPRKRCIQNVNKLTHSPIDDMIIEKKHRSQVVCWLCDRRMTRRNIIYIMWLLDPVPFHIYTKYLSSGLDAGDVSLKNKMLGTWICRKCAQKTSKEHDIEICDEYTGYV